MGASFALLALLSACGTSTIAIPEEGALGNELADLAAAIAVWNDFGIASYRYKLQISSLDGCPQPSLEIVVHNHFAQTVRFGENWIDCTTQKIHHRGADAEAQFSKHKRTIGDLLVQLVWAFQSPFGAGAYFHPKYGFPISYRFSDLRLPGHDYDYQITRFEIL
jgi:hypothetical protein